MKIICIGRNYIEHIRELSNTKTQEPLFFLKPETAIQPKRHPFFIPDFSNNIQYEVELVIKIEKNGKHIQEQFAHKYYSTIGLGIDFTARDLQLILIESGLPWEKAKGFDGSAVIGEWFDKSNFEDINQLDFQLQKNGVVVQEGNTSQMLWKIDELIAEISQSLP